MAEENKRPAIPELAHYYDIAQDNESEKNTETSNRYSNRLLIGEGGMKVIEKTFDSLSGREVALATAKNPDDITDFINEARLTASLEHPNIIPVYDVGEIDSEPFFTMKLIRGQSLSQLIKGFDKNDIPLHERIQLFLKICDAIAYSHDCGILHLDLKPDNIQVNDFGEVLVCDWGLSRQKGDTVNLNKKNIDLKIDVTLHGSVKGTPGYMAPEQAFGHNEKRDEKSDLFSLGTILYQLICEQAYFPGKTLKDYQKFLLEEDADWSSLVIPKALQAVLKKALSVDHLQRYATVVDLTQDLNAWLNGYATEAEDASFLTQVNLLMHRHKTLLTVSLVAFVLLVLSSGFFLRRLWLEQKNTLREAAKRMELSAQAAPEFLNRATQAYERFNFAKAIANVDMALQLDPRNLQARNLKGLLLIGETKYKESLNFLGENMKILRDIAEEFKNRRPRPEDLSSLFRKFKMANYEPLTAMTIQHESKPMDLNNKVKFTKRILELNGRVSPEAFIYDEKLNSLKIQSSGFKNLALVSAIPVVNLDLSGTDVTNLKAIVNFPLKSLNLSHTRVTSFTVLVNKKLASLNLSGCKLNDLRQLKNLSVNHLDLSGVKINNLKPLFECKNLKSVVLTKSLIPQNGLKKLEDNVKVIWR